MAGCAFGYPIVDGRLQRVSIPQILFIGVFSTNNNAVFLFFKLKDNFKISTLSVEFQHTFVSRFPTPRHLIG